MIKGTKEALTQLALNYLYTSAKTQEDYYVDQNDTLNDVDMSEYDYYVDLNDSLNDVDMSEYDYYVDLNDSFQ